MIELQVERLNKRFALRTIFAEISMRLVTGDALAVTGRNGSGKSTLLKLLANVSQPSGGTIRWSVDGAAVEAWALATHIGFVAPYLQLYSEYTAWEHVELLQQLRDLPFDAARALALFERLDLAHRRDERIATYSSGMLQRVKLICALIHRPAFLFLDEPMTNLDTSGIAAMQALVVEERAERITIVATNEADDLRLCTMELAIATAGAED